MSKGKVLLVGAGPGDPGLITVKGMQAIQQADVILYDGLANPALLVHAPDECERINVEKKPGFQRVQQDEINQLMIDRATSGCCVVRLKGGDPIVFGRGGEEAEVLKRAGIEFEIVPGISSAFAAPAYAGIPVTHRGLSTHVTVVTGTTAALEGQDEVDWETLAKAGGTLLILMGTRKRGEIANRLMKAGRHPDTPVTAIQWGTLSVQKTKRTCLGDLGEVEVQNPAVIVVGEVASLDLSWFENRPLFGRRIVVTRSRDQASSLVEGLSVLGSDVLEVPTVQIDDPEDWVPVDRAIERVGLFDWLVFTSSNGVERFFERILSQGKDLRILKGVKIAVVGPATAQKVQTYYLQVDVCPERHLSEGLVEAFESQILSGQRVLVVRPEVMGEAVGAKLQDLGGEVEEVVAYRTVRPEGWPERMDWDTVDLVTFSSSSTVQNLVAMVGENALKTVVTGIPAACIGPKTSATARKHGFRVVAEPAEDEISIPGLIGEIEAYFSG
ncbi:MAG: uroporphyrinogen-III C-methyltransferase [bacterium]|nr:uroporphyrinogen-III C-methyltransferase [bacterium]